jgi:hypothetical protein
MKKPWFFASLLLLSLTLNACQCTEKPPIGPVEEGSTRQVTP